MASSTALLRSVSKNLFSGNLFRLRSLRVAPSATVSFRTSAQTAMRLDDDDRTISVPRDFSVFFTGRVFPIAEGFEPFATAQTVNQPKKATVYPSVSMSPTGEKEAKGRGYHLREDEEALYVKIDMPGLGKEDVKVSVKDNALIIRGDQANKEETESEDEDDDQESGRRYSTEISLAPNAYKYDEIKAEMKNGVLNVTVPVLKEEERKDIIRVQVN